MPETVRPEIPGAELFENCDRGMPETVRRRFPVPIFFKNRDRQNTRNGHPIPTLIENRDRPKRPRLRGLFGQRFAVSFTQRTEMPFPTSTEADFGSAPAS